MLLVSFCLCAFYSTLTILKVLQWMIHEWGGGKKEMYVPSLAVAVKVVSLALFPTGKEVNKIPRKDLRQITDKWIADYNQKVQDDKTRKPKSFNSLEEARAHFQREFYQDNCTYYSIVLNKMLLDFIHQPLGLCAMLAVSTFILVSPFLMLREFYLCGGSNELVCKMGVAAALGDIYVIHCIEGISYNEAMHKYPWTSGNFNRKQPHPMIGGAVCPIYQREIILPDDKMNFEVEFLPNPSGSGILRQKFSSRLQSWWKYDLLETQVVVALMVLYILQSGQAWDTFKTVAPFALVFYSVRSVVDCLLGIQWISIYKYLP